MKMLRVGGLIALVLGVALALYLSVRQFGGATPAASASAGSDQLGAPPPEAVRSSPKVARQYVERQNCLANCTSARRTCEGAAAGAEGAQGGRDQAKACEADCPQP
jgi:nucleoid-associated protein YgaU